MKAFTDLLEETFDAKACPITTKAFLSAKFVLPGYRAPDYFDQDHLNKMALMNLILLTLPGVDRDLDEVTRGSVGNVMLAASCGRPTLFLERDLGEILLDSNLPADLDTSDIKRPFPSIRIMLPKGLLTIERNGVESSMMYLDIGFLEKMVELSCPKAIAAELDLNSFERYGPEPGKLHLTRLSFCYDEACIIICGCLDKGEIDFAPTAYGLTKPWKPGPVENLKLYREKLITSWPTDQSDDVLLAKMENLALNILLLLSSVPFEYAPDLIERKARTEGKRTIPALIKARWVGDTLLRARKAGHVQGDLNGHKSPCEHWRRAHYVRQAYGPRYSLRRLIWILPVHVGRKEAA